MASFLTNVSNAIFGFAFLFGFTVSDVHGLQCSVCHRIGTLGSQDCSLMPCNNPQDVKLSNIVLAALEAQIDFGMGKSTDHNHTGKTEPNANANPILPDSFAAVLGWDRLQSPPVCVKTVGTIGPLNLPYTTAGCVSAGRFEVKDPPCEIRFAPENDLLLGVQMTQDKLCVCGPNSDTSTQNQCHVSSDDLNGSTLSGIQSRSGSTREPKTTKTTTYATAYFDEYFSDKE